MVDSFDPICNWNVRLLHSNLTGKHKLETVIKYSYWSGYLNSNPFWTHASSSKWCATALEYFGCKYSARDGLYTTIFKHEHMENVNYLNLHDAIPINLHRVNTPMFTPQGAAFVVTESSKLDICPTENQVDVTWNITLARCRGLQLYCAIDEEPLSVPAITTRECQNQGQGLSNLQRQVTVKRRGDERLTFVSCSLDSELQYSLTFIVDWAGAPHGTGN
nr:unnamed protein product [Spirometra erinaceieuropaei]